MLGWVGRSDRLAVQRSAVVEHEGDGVDGDAVDLDLEVEVVAGGGPGGAFDPESLSHPHAGAGDDGGVDAGEVPIEGAYAAAVVEDHGIPVAAVGAGAHDDPGRGSDDRTRGRLRDEVLSGVQLPPVVDRGRTAVRSHW